MPLTGAPTPREMEKFSYALLAPAVVQAGYFVQQMEDFGKIDVELRALAMSVPHRLSIQMKSILVSNLPPCPPDKFFYDLNDISLYDLLRKPSQVSVPNHVLMVAILPDDMSHWAIDHNTPPTGSTTLQHGVYWLNLINAPPTTNTTSIRLTIPRAQRVTGPEIARIMTHIAQTGRAP